MYMCSLPAAGQWQKPSFIQRRNATLPAERVWCHGAALTGNFAGSTSVLLAKPGSIDQALEVRNCREHCLIGSTWYMPIQGTSPENEAVGNEGTSMNTEYAGPNVVRKCKMLWRGQLCIQQLNEQNDLVHC